MKSKLVAISSISAGLTAIALLVGAYFEVADLCALVISSTFVTLPLYYKSYKASLLAALAGGLIAFMCSGFNVMSLIFPSFIAFFGVYPIVSSKMQEKNVKKFVRIMLGIIWFVAVAYGMYFYYTAVMGVVLLDIPGWLADIVLYVIAPLAVIVFFIYDKFIVLSRMFINRYLGKIVK